MWERSLFKQRNMHWPRQRIQLQLSTRIFGQSMWNWWAVCLAVIFIVYRLENLYTNWRCWSCMFTCCCFYMKKRFIGIYSFLSQVSIRWSQYAVKNPPLKWFLVSFVVVVVCNLYLWLLFPSDINECEGRPCLNNGTCTDRINAFNCSCSPGFSGNRCEIG